MDAVLSVISAVVRWAALWAIVGRKPFPSHTGCKGSQ